MYKYLPTAVAIILATQFASNLHAKPFASVPVKPKIIGGTEAEQDSYPWMSALVTTYPSPFTSLIVANSTISTTPMSNSPGGTATGNIVDCGLAKEVCLNAEGNICLIERGEIDFSDKVLNCENGGGIAAVVYNNVDGILSGTLTGGFSGTIPAVGITQSDGLNLLQQINSLATVEVSEDSRLAQSSSCGASHIGNGWILTAAHCVDYPGANERHVNIGEYNLNDGAENASNIESIYIYPDYTFKSSDDIALIKVSNYSDAPSIKLADFDTTQALSLSNAPATVIGWGGRTGYAPGEGPTSNFPDILHHVDVSLFNAEQCREITAESLTRDSDDGTVYTIDDVYVSDKEICAGRLTGGHDACQGDSGGPLIAQTNDGVRQLGIVSGGMGCAYQGYLGKYTLIGAYTDWIEAITNGVAISQAYNFKDVPITTQHKTTLTVDNHSGESVNISYEIEGSNAFSVNGNSCQQLGIDESCDIEVAFSSTMSGRHEANVVIKSNNPNIATSQSKIRAESLSASNNLKSDAGASGQAITFYSGGDEKWESNPAETGLRSGEINHFESSILMAVVKGKGTLTFDWSVSSEENTDDPTLPFDALYLEVNNQQIEFISGEVDFTEYKVSLTEDSNIIKWVYKKDPRTSEGEDRAYLRNVNYTQNQTNTTTESRTSSSGGSMAWITLLFFYSILIIRKAAK
ncbi:trypsin-like serine protease [Flocculibacter collagenilyticus]|uniref:trypsin-like serine protease n=1 Tax=Flocculibacter collagenilyticus TaxID=2744479 RepID=UPI0018F42545|nr:trypsin-like serine protease [Flocculibacter collagenilyticus]